MTMASPIGTVRAFLYLQEAESFLVELEQSIKSETIDTERNKDGRLECRSNDNNSDESYDRDEADCELDSSFKEYFDVSGWVTYKISEEIPLGPVSSASVTSRVIRIIPGLAEDVASHVPADFSKKKEA